MYLTVGGFSFYNLLEHYLINSGNDKKLMYNRISLTHNLSAIFFIMLYFNKPENLFLSDLAVGNTLGFFINDSLRYIKLNRYRFSDIVFIYHHIATSIYIYNKRYNLNSYWAPMLFWAEISNIPSQLVYYYIQKKRLNGNMYHSNLVLAKKIQLYFYGLIRTFILSYYLFKEYTVIGIDKNLVMTTPLIFLGYIWTYIMYKSDQIASKKNNV